MHSTINTLAYQDRGGKQSLEEYVPGTYSQFIIDVVESKSVKATRWTIWNYLTQNRSGSSTPPIKFRGYSDPSKNKLIIMDFIKSTYNLK